MSNNPDLPDLLYAAWQALKPHLDASALHKRLARRRGKTFRQPPRPWCLAIKASDRRIDDFFGYDPAKNKFRTGPQQLEITAPLIRRLTRPLALEYHTEKIHLARKLGVNPAALDRAISRGIFDLRRVPLLGGKKAKPIPLLSTRNLLDPGSGRHWRLADPIWGTHHAFLCDRVPKNLHQQLTRIPIFRSIRQPRLSLELQPWEMARKLYQPPKDPLDLTKWTKDGQYIPDKADLRRAHRRELYRQNRNQRLLDRQRRQEQDPTAPLPQDPTTRSPRFMGFLWLCPLCKRTAKILYFPLFAVYAFNLLGDDDPPPGSHDGLHIPRQTFACSRCHRIKHCASLGSLPWNYLVSHLSGGLLYGHEVPRPAWFPSQRRQEFRKRKTPKPSPRTDEVERRLLAGESFATISRAMNISPITAHGHAHRIYKKYKVANLSELAAKKAIPTTLPAQLGYKRKRVLELLLKGHTSRQIAAALNIRPKDVCVYYHHLYRQHNVHSKQQLLAKLRDSTPTANPAHDSRAASPPQQQSP